MASGLLPLQETGELADSLKQAELGSCLGILREHNCDGFHPSGSM